MRVFLSYAHEDLRAAEEIATALRSDGHEVFFDQETLRGSESYHRVIRQQIQECDRFVFLISPNATRSGKYCLTELRMIRERWPSPEGRTLPVLIEPTSQEAIPAYLRGITILHPEGNPAAEVAARLAPADQEVASPAGNGRDGHGWTPRAVQQLLVVTTGCLCLMIVILSAVILLATDVLPVEHLGAVKAGAIGGGGVGLALISAFTVRIGLSPVGEAA